MSNTHSDKGTNMKAIEQCPVCQLSSEVQKVKYEGEYLFIISCPRCGKYQVNDVTNGYLNLEEYRRKSDVLSHAIRKMQKNNETPFLSLDAIRQIIQNPL